MLIPQPERLLFAPRDSAIKNPAPLRDKGKRGVKVLTATGTIELRRRYFWSRSAGGTCPSDASIGIRDQTVSSGARCLLCTLGIIHDFKQAAADLQRVAGIRVSAERLRQIVESEGRRIKESRLSGRFEPGWSASQAEQVYVGVDGVMVRGVTEVEKKKRRKQSL